MITGIMISIGIMLGMLGTLMLLVILSDPLGRCMIVIWVSSIILIFFTNSIFWAIMLIAIIIGAFIRSSSSAVR